MKHAFMKKISNLTPYYKIVSCILAKTFSMKKLLFVSIILCMALQTFSYSPGRSSANISYSLPVNLNAMALQELINFTPKKYQELTGQRMTFKQKLSLYLLKAKFKKELASENTPHQKYDPGKTSLILGAGAFHVALIPVAGIVSIPMAIGAIIFGIIGLGRKKGDSKSIIGLVLGTVFLLLIVAVIAVVLSSWVK